MDFVTSALVLAWIAIIVLAVLVSAILRSLHGIVHPALGNRSAKTPVGSRIDLPEVDVARSGAVLVFMDDICESCHRTRSKLLSGGARSLAEAGLAVTLMYRHEGVDGNANGIRVLSNRTQVFDLLGIHAVPTAAHLGRDGTLLALEPVGSEDLLDRFIDSVRQPIVRWP